MATQSMSIGKDIEGYHFKIGLLIKHPDKDLSNLAELIEVEPDFVQKAGARRQTPTGRVLKGSYSEHIWSSYRRKTSKDFVSEIENLIETLYLHKAVFKEIADTGGSSKIVVQLPGSENLGLEISHLSSGKLADLKIDVGLEVFPHY